MTGKEATPSSAIDTSLVLVTRDDEDRMTPLLTRAARALRKIPRSEVVVVDDASVDGTLQRVQEHEHKLPNLSVVRHQHARGAGDAVRTGIGQARGDYVFVGEVGADLPISMLRELRRSLVRGADVALATRPPGQRERGLDGFQRLSETAFTTLARLLITMPTRDVHAVFRGFRRRAAKILAMRTRVRNGSYAVEWLGLAQKLKLRVDELPCPALTPVDAHLPGDHSLRDLWRIRKDLAAARYRQVRKDFGSLADTSILRRNQLGI